MPSGIIACWFSNGAASACAAMMTIKKYGRDRVRVLNSPVKEEHPDNARFRADCENWLNHPIETVVGKSVSAEEVWIRRKFMASPEGAPCTLEIKKEARYAFERTCSVVLHVLGFTAEEAKRAVAFKAGETDRVEFPLLDAGWSKQDCIDHLLAAGIKPSVMYYLGFPNANCIGCVKATSPTYWHLVKKHFPDVFEKRRLLADKLGAKLVRVRGERISLTLLQDDDVGNELNSMDMECGLFCGNYIIGG